MLVGVMACGVQVTGPDGFVYTYLPLDLEKAKQMSDDEVVAGIARMSEELTKYSEFNAEVTVFPSVLSTHPGWPLCQPVSPSSSGIFSAPAAVTLVDSPAWSLPARSHDEELTMCCRRAAFWQITCRSMGGSAWCHTETSVRRRLHAC